MDKNRNNVVLTGMRGSGKTTVGAVLAGRLQRELIPMDAIIVFKTGMTIPEIVNMHGWNYFRDIEVEVAKKVAQLHGIINATGGGVILNSENMRALRSTGIVFWLDVSVDNILERIGDDPNRPYLNNSATRYEEMTKTLKERESLYLETADYQIDTNDKSQELISGEIIQILQKQHEFKVVK